MSVSRARVAAYEILLRVERESSYASELLHSPAYKGLSARDHALSTELVLGVLRWRSRIDAELSNASSQPLPKLDLEILTALRLGLYQLRCLDRVPERAALYESVELVKHARKRSAASFVNAVLRKLAATNHHYGAALSKKTGIAPNLIARQLAHPPWLVERWAKEYGAQTAERICEYGQSIPLTAIRLRKPSAEDELRKEGVTLQPSQLLSSARIVVAGDITKTGAFRDRQAVIQDQASQLVAALVGISRPRSRILDCCAAPGGKTLAMADRHPDATITAMELHSHRARLLKKLLREAEIGDKIELIVGNAESLPVSTEFDRVLADVPCSGTGTLARNPEIKWRLQQEDLNDLQVRQLAILRSAKTRVRNGGRIIYSTCSLEREENEAVVEQALAQNDSLRLIDCREELEHLKQSGDVIWPDLASLTKGPYLRTIPGVHPCDGFFTAILEKA